MAFFLDDLLLAPVKGVVWIAEKIQEQADREFMDEDGVKHRLTELYMRLETSQISEEEFEQEEAALVEQLEAIEEYKGTRAHL